MELHDYAIKMAIDLDRKIMGEINLRKETNYPFGIDDLILIDGEYRNQTPLESFIEQQQYCANLVYKLSGIPRELVFDPIQS